MATVATFGIGLPPSESAVATFGTDVATFVYDSNHHGILNFTNTQRRHYMYLRIGHVTADFINFYKKFIVSSCKERVEFPVIKGKPWQTNRIRRKIVSYKLYPPSRFSSIQV